MKKSVRTAPASSILASLLKEIDDFSRRGTKRSREGEELNNTAADGSTASPSTIEQTLRALNSVLLAHGPHLLPSAGLVASRLMSLVPADSSTTLCHGFWATLSTFGAIVRSAARRIVTEAFTYLMLFPRMAAAVSVGDLTHLANIVSTVGPHLSSQLLQQFAMRLAQEELQPLHNAIEETFRSGAAVSPYVVSLATVCTSVLLVCRPVPPTLLALARVLLIAAGSRATTTSDLITLQQLGNVASLLTYPTALPFYAPPEEVVHVPAPSVPRKAPQPVESVSPAAAVEPSHHHHHQMAASSSSLSSSVPQHPALALQRASPRLQAVRSPRHQPVAAPLSSDKKKFSPAMRPSKPSPKHTSSVVEDSFLVFVFV